MLGMGVMKHADESSRNNRALLKDTGKYKNFDTSQYTYAKKKNPLAFANENYDEDAREALLNQLAKERSIRNKKMMVFWSCLLVIAVFLFYLIFA